jgi:hypothetical protein
MPPPHVHHLLPNLWKASYTIIVSTAVDVQQWPPYSTNSHLYCVVTRPSQLFFHFGEDVIIVFVRQSEVSNDTCWQRTPSPFMTIQGLILLTLSRSSFAAGNGRYWNIRRTRYESVQLWPLRQNERTTARDKLQHKRGDYWCCRAVTAGRPQKWTRWWCTRPTTHLAEGGTYVGRGIMLKEFECLAQVIKCFQNYSVVANNLYLTRVK